MKAKINYKSKKTIIIIAIAVILLIAAVIGTVAFIKGNNDAAAAMVDEPTTAGEGQENNGGTDDQNGGNPNENPQTGLPDGELGDGTTTGNEGTVVDGNGNAGTTGNVGNNAATGNGGTTGTTTGRPGTGNVPNQDYTQTTTIVTENPWETKQIGWNPLSISAFTAVADLGINRPNLSAEKIAYVQGDSLEGLPVNTAIQKGEIITYVIKVANKGALDATSIRTIDAIPEGTELVENSITENGTLENGKITWKTDIKVGETAELSFQVKVTADEITLIENTAKVNGGNTNITENPVITSAKQANVLVDGELLDRDVKVGETIRYTITVTNKSEVDGITTISDKVPEGTTYAQGSASEGAKVSEDGTITWNNVAVLANGEVKVSFDVTVNKDRTESVKNIAIVGDTETEETETKVANITTVKLSEGSAEPLHELDTITYTLKATNSGNGTGTVVLTDEVPEGTTLVENSIKLDGEGLYTEKDLNEGISVTLAEGESKSVTFTVKINPFKEESKTIYNLVAKQDGTTITPGTEDKVEKEYITVTANKEFIDKENIDGLRPTSVEFELYADGVTTNQTAIADKDNNWTVQFTKLDKYTENETKIEYTIKELNVDANYKESYTVVTEGNNTTVKVVNTLKYENVRTFKTALKIWEDNQNKVNARPTSVILKLYANGAETERTEVATEQYKWTVKFQDVQKYDEDGNEIVYTIKELDKNNNVVENNSMYDDHYKTTYGEDGLTVTNTIDYTTFRTQVTVNKIWIEPASVTSHEDITIDLYQNNDEQPLQTAVLTNGTTTYTFVDLPKYDNNGDEYEYTVHEREVAGYNTSWSEDTLTITNTIEQENTVNINGTKTWVDPEGTVHPTITIQLLQNGLPYATATIENGKTDYSFEGLPKYRVDANGNYVLDANNKVQLNVYTVAELNVPGYTSTKNGTDFINTINQKSISVNGTKTWIDPIGTTHPEITINLLRDGKKIDSRKLANGKTTYSFDNLSKYDLTDGHEYEYRVEEENVPGYTKSQSGTNFTNTIEQEDVPISGTKTWIDPEGTVHPTITIRLWQDGTEIAHRELTNGELTYTFGVQPKYDLTDGHEYRYAVTEDDVAGYTSVPDATGRNFTNIINQADTEIINGTKTWIDPVGTVHPTITIRLWQDGTEIAHRELANGELTYTFGVQPKYDLTDGHEYRYVVTEDDVTGYTSVPDATGRNFTNIIEQEDVPISGTKTWIDPEGTVHPTITIRLWQDGTEIAHRELANGELTYTFGVQPKYDLTDGHEYRYVVTEDDVTGYTSVPDATGTNFTNTIEQQKIQVSGTKTWVAPTGVVHPTITIRLWQDGTEIAHRELANGELTYTFGVQPKYDLTDGHEYRYVVTEDDVTGYTSVPDATGRNFTNIIEQEDVPISGTKTWIDPEGTVHPTITIRLWQDGTEIAHRELANGELTYTFGVQPKYDLTDGHEYRYVVTEDDVTGYTSVPDATGTNFTNTIEQQKIQVSGTKTWVAPTGVVHPTITIRLYKDGTEIANKKLVNGTTSYTFDNLDVYDLIDGHVYEYTVSEDEVLGYTSVQNGTNFKNTIEQDYTEVRGTKTWIAPEGTVFPTITINLLRDGEKIDSKTLENGTTTYKFEELPMYNLTNGHTYVYTVSEEAVEGYTPAQNGTNFTNTIAQDYVPVNGTKTWVAPEGTVFPTITINLFRDGAKIASTTIENGATTYSFDSLPKYDLTDGHEYEYTVSENAVDGYTSEQNGYNFTNTKTLYKYKVEYYYDNVIDNTLTEEYDAVPGSVIETYTDKIKDKDKYEFQKVENLPLTVTEDTNSNVIRVYYVTKVFSDPKKWNQRATGNTSVFNGGVSKDHICPQIDDDGQYYFSIVASDNGSIKFPQFNPGKYVGEYAGITFKGKYDPDPLDPNNEIIDWDGPVTPEMNGKIVLHAGDVFTFRFNEQGIDPNYVYVVTVRVK